MSVIAMFFLGTKHQLRLESSEEKYGDYLK